MAPATAQLTGDLAAHESGAAGDRDGAGGRTIGVAGGFEDVVDGSRAEVEDVLQL